MPKKSFLNALMHHHPSLFYLFFIKEIMQDDLIKKYICWKKNCFEKKLSRKKKYFEKNALFSRGGGKF